MNWKDDNVNFDNLHLNGFLKRPSPVLATSGVVHFIIFIVIETNMEERILLNVWPIALAQLVNKMFIEWAWGKNDCCHLWHQSFMPSGAFLYHFLTIRCNNNFTKLNWVLITLSHDCTVFKKAKISVEHQLISMIWQCFFLFVRHSKEVINILRKFKMGVGLWMGTDEWLIYPIWSKYMAYSYDSSHHLNF